MAFGHPSDPLRSGVLHSVWRGAASRHPGPAT